MRRATYWVIMAFLASATTWSGCSSMGPGPSSTPEPTPVAQAPTASSTPGEGPEAISPISVKDYENAIIEDSYLDPGGRTRYLLRPEESFEKAYPGAKIQKGVMDYKKPDGRIGLCVSIDNDGYAYMVFGGTEIDPATKRPYHENEEVHPAEWGMYSLNTREYTPCITLQVGRQIGEIVASDNYVVWHEDESNYAWVRTQWHIYNKRDKSDQIFYTPSRNPETNAVYKISFDTPIILDDMVYLEDIQGYDRFAVSLLSYDIHTKEIKTIAEPAALPMIYEGKIAWLEPAEKKEDNTKIIFRTLELSRICTLEDLAGASSSGNIIAILDRFNGNVEEETKDGGKKGVSIRRSAPDDKSADILSYYAVKIFDGKKIIPLALSGGNHIDWPDTNGRWVVWNDSCANDMRFYDASFDKIIKIENGEETIKNSEEMAIHADISDNYIMFTNNKNEEYYLIDLGELSN